MYGIPALALSIYLGVLLHLPTPHAYGGVFSAVLGALFFYLLILASSRLQQPIGSEIPNSVLTVSALFLAGLCVVRQMHAIFHLPIDAEYADMLPLIRAALESLAVGENPYRTYHFPWPLPLTFLPGLWLSYLPAWALGLDLRLWGLLASLAFLALLVQRGMGRGGLAAWLVLLLLATSSKFDEFARISHLPLYWLMLVLFARDWLLGKRSAFLWLGCLLATRQTAWLLVPPVALHLFGLSDSNPRKRSFLLCLAGALGFSALVVGPFFLRDIASFLTGTLLWYPRLGNLVYASDPVTVLGQPGFGGLLHELGLAGLLPWFCITSLLLCWRRRRETPAGVLASGALASAAFALFSAPCWWYSLLDPVLLLCLALVPERPAISPLQRRLAWLVPCLAVPAWLALVRPHTEALRFDAESAPLLLRGFPGLERWGLRTIAWATAPRAGLALPRLRPFRGELTLLLRPAPRIVLPLLVELNGAVIARLELVGDWREYRIPIAADRFVLGNNSLVFRADAPPHSEMDHRSLMVALDELRLLPLP